MDITCCPGSTVSVQALALDNCWIVGCDDRARMFCNSSTNYTDYTLPKNSVSEFMVVWPYFIIHYDFKTVIYCDISQYTFRCTNFSTNLTGASSAWISEYHQAVQVLVRNQKSRIVAYKEGNSPFVIDFSQKVYAVVQEGYRIIIWAQSGLY